MLFNCFSKALIWIGVLATLGCARRPLSISEVEQKILANQVTREMGGRAGQTILHSGSVVSGGVRTEKFRHWIQGVEVLGSGVSYHEGPSRDQIRDHWVRFEMDPKPHLSPSEALAVARSFEPKESPAHLPVLKIFPPLRERRARLVYQTEMSSGKEVWIDAHSAELIASVSAQSEWTWSADRAGVQMELRGDLEGPKECLISNWDLSDPQWFEIKECEDWASRSCQVMDSRGSVLKVNPEGCTLAQDLSAQRAELNAQAFISYLEKKHQRQSYDDQGSEVRSIVHAGRNFENAVWFKKGKYLVYGDGDGKSTRDFTFSLDIAAHELTHALIQYSAKILSFGEAGAVNESIADYFGKVIEGLGDWSLGKAVFLDPAARGYRNLADPSQILGSFVDRDGAIHQRPAPSKKSQMAPTSQSCTSENDRCSIHYNATIPGHAWYLIDQKLGREKAERLIYLSLIHFLDEFSDFESTATAVLEACNTLYDSRDCSQVRQAFLETEMLGPERLPFSP